MTEKIELPGLRSPEARETWNTMAKLAWPVAIEQFILILVNMVVTMLVGAASDRALAAAGMVNVVVTFTQALFNLLATGGMVVVAHMVGEGKKEAAREACQQTYVMAVWSSLAVMVLGLAGATPLIRLLMPNGDALLRADTVLYMRIIMVGLPGLILNTALGNLLRGAGDTRTPMVVAFVSNGALLVAGFLLVKVFHAGLAGIGWATTAARTLSALAMFPAFFGHRARISLAPGRLFHGDRAVIRRICWVGLPVSIEQGAIQAMYVVQNALITGMGTQAATVYQVANSVNTIPGVIQTVFCTTSIALVGQRLGAGRRGEAKLASLMALAVGGILTVLLSVAEAVFGRSMCSLYTQDAGVMAEAGRMLWIMVIAAFPALTINVMAGTLRTAGDGRYAMWLSILGVWAVRTPLLWLFCFKFNWGVAGAYAAQFSDYFVRCTGYFIRFFSNRWMQHRV